MNSVKGYIFIFFILVSLFWNIAPALSSQSSDKPIVVALRDDFPPFSFINDDGKPSGIFVDMWRLWAERIGVKIDFFLASRPETIEAVKRGTVDAVGHLHPLDYRKEFLAFSDVLYEFNSGIYSIYKLKGISDLQGLKIGVVSNTFEETHLKYLLPKSHIIHFRSLKDLIYAAAQKEIDAFCANSTATEYILIQKGYTGYFHIIDRNLMYRDLKAGVLKDNYHLLSLINKGFGKITLKELASIEERWIHNPSIRYFQRAKKGFYLSDEEKDWLYKNPRVKIGYLTSYPPYYILDIDGNPSGLAKDYLDIVESLTGLRFEFVIKEHFKDIKPLVESSDILMLPFVVKIPERQDYLDFSNTYQSIKAVVITRDNDSAINSLSDLKNKKVGAIYDSVVWEKFSKDPNLHLVAFDSNRDLFEALSMGKIDAIIDSLPSAHYYMTRFGITNLKIAYTLPQTYEVSFGFAKGQEHLKSIVNKVLDSISPDEHREIYEKWQKYYAPAKDWKKILRWAAVFVFLFLTVLLVSLVWNKRLKNERENLQILIDTAPVGIAILDRKLNLIKFNNKAERYLSLKTYGSTDTRLCMLFNCINSQRDNGGCGFSEACKSCALKNAIDLLFEQGQNTEGIEINVLDAEDTNKSYWLRLNVSRLVMDKQTYAVVSLDDITNQKVTERLLTIAKEIAEKATKAKSEFLSNLSHEIRTPLNALINMNLLLSETELDETQREFVNTAVKSSEMLLALVNDILDFSKIEAGRIELEHQPVAISEIIMSVVTVLNVKAQEKNISFTYKIDKSANIVVYVDSLRLKQILLNLISNAIKFTEEGGVHVEVLCIQKDDDVANISFSVSDTGIGIKSNLIEKIFDSFTQADSSTTRRYGGTGLGLAISKRLVEMMGGTMKVHSIEGEGSTFTFNILAEMVKAPQFTSDTLEETITIPKGLDILLVEDNQLNQVVIKGMLRNSQNNLDIANNGIEAVKMAKEKCYSLILMDIEMPEMDGIEATKHIRNLHKPNSDTPVIAITAHSDKQKIDSCLKAGMNDFITKPVDKKALFNVINAVIKTPPMT